MAVQTPEPTKVPAKLKKMDKKSKSSCAVSEGLPYFHKRTRKRDPADMDACEACDYNCCCEMLRLAVKKLGGRRDNYMIQGQLQVYRGAALVARGEISVRIQTTDPAFTSQVPSLPQCAPPNNNINLE
jgi:hypothetical protein